VVDDGDRFPADADAVSALGGRLLRVEPGTPLGTKLNRGAAEAHGPLCQKMDDDDWYGPRFLHTMLSALQASRAAVCRPTVAFVMPFLLFDVARWEVRRSVANNAPGATLLFAREDWQEHPFRALSQDEDVWFYHDQLRAGARPLPVGTSGIFLAVRHRGSASDRDHTWTRQGNGQVLEDYFQTRPLHAGGPESLLPSWALTAYRDLHDHLLAGSA
jgi:glycosyltransferase involved in cell wall biosynthesis